MYVIVSASVGYNGGAVVLGIDALLLCHQLSFLSGPESGVVIGRNTRLWTKPPWIAMSPDSYVAL